MTTITSAAKPGYSVSSAGQITRSTALMELFKAYRSLKTRYEQANATYVGAAVIQLLMAHGWLSGCKITLEAKSEMGDEGESFRSIYVSVSDATLIEGVETPDDVGDDFDEDHANAFIEELVQDEAGALYDYLMGEHDYDTVSLSIDRSKVAHLLGQESICGQEALLLLFPEHAGLITPMYETAVQAQSLKQ